MKRFSLRIIAVVAVLYGFGRPAFTGLTVLRGPIISHKQIPRRAEGDAFNKAKFLRKSEFDLLSLQDFRREALIQYSNTNQSEPLRILIFLFLTICGLSAPGFAPSNAAPWYFAVAVVFTAVFGFLFFRERGKRTAQLVRLEREYAIGDLTVEVVEPLGGSKKLQLQARIILKEGEVCRSRHE